jgi:hypothetical protein
VARSRIVLGSRSGPSGRIGLAVPAGFALLSICGLLALAAPGSGIAAGLWQGMLYLLPALLLLLVLLARRYPGERLLGALRVRRARGRARVRAGVAVRRIELPVPHGGRLIAVSLAGRAPPLAWAGARD